MNRSSTFIRILSSNVKQQQRQHYYYYYRTLSSVQQLVCNSTTRSIVINRCRCIGNHHCQQQQQQQQHHHYYSTRAATSTASDWMNTAITYTNPTTTNNNNRNNSNTMYVRYMSSDYDNDNMDDYFLDDNEFDRQYEKRYTYLKNVRDQNTIDEATTARKQQQRRKPIVLTNMMKSNHYNNTTTTTMKSQLSRIVSRMTLLKLRHPNIVLKSNNSNSKNQQQQQPVSSSSLSNLFTNYQHGMNQNNNTSTSRRTFSTISSSNNNGDNDNSDDTTKTTTTVTTTPVINLPYIPFLPVYGKRDFLELQQSNYIEIPVSKKQMDALYKEQQENIVAENSSGDGDNNGDEVEPINKTSDEDNDEMVYFAVTANMEDINDIQRIAEEQFGTTKTLQYYHMGTNTWNTIDNENDLDLLQTYYFECIHPFRIQKKEDRVIPIRIQEYYVTDDKASNHLGSSANSSGGYNDNEYDDYDEDDEDENLQSSPPPIPTSNFDIIEVQIELLLQQLIESNWMRCDDNDDNNINNNNNTDTSNSTNRSSTKNIMEYRLMKEVTFDNSIDDNTINQNNNDIDKSSIVSDPYATTTTNTAITSPSMTTATNISLDEDRLITDATTTIVPNEQEPNKTKTYMYMYTKDYILSQANHNTTLRGLLFYYPFVLEHIIECLHYPFLWDNYYLKDASSTTTSSMNNNGSEDESHDFYDDNNSETSTTNTIMKQ